MLFAVPVTAVIRIILMRFDTHKEAIRDKMTFVLCCELAGRSWAIVTRRVIVKMVG